MIRAAIFDLDGTMFDTEPIWAHAWSLAFEAEGIGFDPQILEACVGAAPERVMAIVDEWHGGDPRAMRAVRAHYDIARELLLRGAPEKPGLHEILDMLGRNGVRLAVASSSSRELICSHLAHGGISDLFEVIVSGTEVRRSKPAPDIFLEAARELGVRPGEALVVEDSPSGVCAGATGGFRTFLVPDSVEPDEATLVLCEGCVASLTELCVALLDMHPEWEQAGCRGHIA